MKKNPEVVTTLNVWVYIRVYMYVYVHVCIYMCTCVACVYVSACVHVCIYVCVCDIPASTVHGHGETGSPPWVPSSVALHFISETGPLTEPRGR